MYCGPWLNERETPLTFPSIKQVRYIEAHGTGTKLGDSVEMTALAAVMAPGRDRPDGTTSFCIIASGKSNIGHLEAAAGVLGLIRAALILHYGKVRTRTLCEFIVCLCAFDQRLSYPTHIHFHTVRN